jgi:hypothetical protein
VLYENRVIDLFSSFWTNYDPPVFVEKGHFWSFLHSLTAAEAPVHRGIR